MAVWKRQTREFWLHCFFSFWLLSFLEYSLLKVYQISIRVGYRCSTRTRTRTIDRLRWRWSWHANKLYHISWLPFGNICVCAPVIIFPRWKLCSNRNYGWVHKPPLPRAERKYRYKISHACVRQFAIGHDLFGLWYMISANNHVPIQPGIGWQYFKAYVNRFSQHWRNLTENIYVTCSRIQISFRQILPGEHLIWFSSEVNYNLTGSKLGVLIHHPPIHPPQKKKKKTQTRRNLFRNP